MSMPNRQRLWPPRKARVGDATLGVNTDKTIVPGRIPIGAGDTYFD